MINAIDPAKDVDGLHPVNLGRLVMGQPGLVPCTPQGCMILIKTCVPSLSGLRAVVVGRSFLVGKPAALLLSAEDATVTMAHSKTKNLVQLCREAHILVAAAGRQGLITADHVKPGAIVIDVGITRLGANKLAGDVDFEEVSKIAGHITPVPGGVGPMTVACLLKNTLQAAQAFG
jgi:methylenetetrahydrofolate dehydrogenase (NADP+) / methenyltetrahydrofolate cyclohydrolase